MKPSAVVQALLALITINEPAFLWGAPGVGKSDIVRAVATQLDRRLVDLRAVYMQPTDLLGLPTLDATGQMVWTQPARLPREGTGILFLDELNVAPPMMQAACYELTLDRRIGDYRLPDDWAVVAAGNRETDRAAAQRMPSALANRLVHLDVDPDLDDWRAWAVSHDVRPEIIAFLSWRPELLTRFEAGQRAFPSPRTWVKCSRILGAAAGSPVELPLLTGAIGEGAALELTAFLRIYRALPSLDQILLDPAGAPVPDQPSALYAVASGLARRASAANFSSVVAYANRLPAEFGVCLVSDAIRRDSALTASAAFTQWAAQNGNLLV